jgi:hypothetical protein
LAIGLPDSDFLSECPGEPGLRYGNVCSLFSDPNHHETSRSGDRLA